VIGILRYMVRNIRRKIEIYGKNLKYLKMVWGVGYKIEKH